MTQPYPGPNGWQQHPQQQAPAAGWTPLGAVPPQQTGPVPPPMPTPPKTPFWRTKKAAGLLLIGALMAACGLSSGGQAAAPAASTAPTSSSGQATARTFNGVPVDAAPAVAAEPAPAPAVLQPARAITARQWQLIAKNPDAHTGERLVVYGQVTQFDSVTGTEGFRANVDGVEHKVKYGFADYDTNTILHSDDATVLGDVVQGDLFKAEVTVAGTLSYQTTMGGTMTAPKLTVTKISNIGHVD